MLKHILAGVMAAMLALPAFAAFDPVNDDTDIFLANPNIPAERPNVLIILDNTANWNTPFTNEKSALVTVINSLNESFNVGLMLFPETGSPNDSVDGGYVKFHVRQMTTTNKSAFSTMLNSLDKLADKGNNATTGLAMYEAYLYYAGEESLASFGKVKTDFAGNTANNPLAAALAGNHALDANPNAASPYHSPIVDGCQKNFIIYISNGPAAENATARSTLQGYLSTLTLKSPPDTIAITPNGQQGNWADEVAQYMANADVNASVAETQHVITYTIEVNPGATGQGPDMTALLQSMASKGKGKYFGVTDSANGAGIVDALNQIFTDVQAVNSVFASTTLPVSVNVRGTNLNQVYIGVFRPDAAKLPRWLGNLKLYDLKLNTTNNTVFLADKDGKAAEDSTTGFISSTSTSFWTSASLTPTNFWSFRSADQNSAGGDSDAPDGELVEKGGAAQQTRHYYESDQTPRKLYTCTTGGGSDCIPCSASGSGTDKTCSGGSSLSATPFSTGNSTIEALLSLNTHAVSPLSALRTITLSALTDRKTAILSNAVAGGVSKSVTSLSNGATTATISSLTTNVTKTLTSLSALATSSQTVSLVSIKKVSGNFVVTYSGTLPSNFVNGATISITGASVGVYNASWTMSSLNTTAQTFNINVSGNPGDSTGGTALVSSTASSTLAVATLASHGFTSGDNVTIAGATPAAFNGTFTITVMDSSHFQYVIATTQGAATGTITASSNTTKATATTVAAHGFSTGNSVTISGANPTGYNGTFTIASVPSTTTFTYTVGTALVNNTSAPVYAVKGGSTTVTATSAAHGFSNGDAVTIAGSSISGYNGTFTIFGVTTDTFQYTTASVLPASSGTVTATASVGYDTTVTAAVTAHGFSTGDNVTIAGTDPNFTGAFTITNVDADHFTYVDTLATVPPTAGSTFTARLTSPIAYATATAHGFSSGDSITINGATPAAYNGTFIITKVDGNNFTYPLSSAPGASTVAGTASINTTTALATSVAHGFVENENVTISGATPNAFNGTYAIHKVDDNHFTYPLASAQGEATGTITALASGSTGSAGADIINWVRGRDNFEDENANTLLTDVRASIHGDVLHSRPAVINYNRFGGDNDVYVFYGANDSVFHAVKGGLATDSGDSSGLTPGQEAWGFIPSEFFSKLSRLRNNSPSISGFNKRPYFADGPIGVLSVDGDVFGTSGFGKLGDSADTVNLYVAMRRGGRFIYALDVNNPADPKLLWKISNSSTGFSELGQTWSEPKVVARDTALDCSFNGYKNPVVIFGAGYDPTVEDLEPSTITASTATTVTTAAGTFTRSMGRGIYVVDAVTGELVVSIGRTGSGANKTVSGMDYAIPSDVTVIRNESGGCINRAYVGDTGGNLWRLDFGATYNSASPGDWVTVTPLASIGSTSSNANRRKFLFPPEVVAQSGFYAILIGSGDREHPFDATVVNRMYMFKDRGNDAAPYTGTIRDDNSDSVIDHPTIVEGAMYDATNNCLQVTCTGTTVAEQATLLNNSDGWYITLGSGEKVTGNSVALAGTVFFNTNQPSASAGGGSCGSNLGIARQYQVAVADATATSQLDTTDGSLNTADRSEVHAGGGYLPSPVHVVVQFTDEYGNTITKEVVISGTSVQEPQQTPIGTRYRKYWWKEIDQ